MMRYLRVQNRTAANDREPVDPDLPAQQGLASRGPFHVIKLTYVGIGGAFGTFARYWCSITWPTTSGHFPTTILTVNISGAFLIGVVISVLVRIGRIDGPRLFAGVGILGGWTTMSSAAISADLLIAHHHVIAGIGYLVVTVLGGAVATACGIAIAHRAVPVHAQ